MSKGVIGPAVDKGLASECIESGDEERGIVFGAAKKEKSLE